MRTRTITTLSTIAATGLLVTACSGATDTENQTGHVTATETATVTEEVVTEAETPAPGEAPEDPQENENQSGQLTIGEPVHIGGLWGTGNANLTVTEASVGQGCMYGQESWVDTLGTEEPGEGMAYLQLTADLEVIPEEDSGSMSLWTPSYVDSEGYTQSPEYAMDCADGGNEDWISSVNSGQKSRLYGVWIVPANAEAVLIEDEYRLDLN